MIIQGIIVKNKMKNAQKKMMQKYWEKLLNVDHKYLRSYTTIWLYSQDSLRVNIKSVEEWVWNNYQILNVNEPKRK